MKLVPLRSAAAQIPSPKPQVAGACAALGEQMPSDRSLDLSKLVMAGDARMRAYPTGGDQLVAKAYPTPYTLHLTPYTLHPTPYTLHPTLYTLHPSPCTLHAALSTLHPAPYTLQPLLL